MLASMSLKLRAIVELLERVAPLELAEAWDNVGLLMEPSDAAARDFERMLLTIDLSSAVLAEAANKRADFLLAYHPPIFKGLTRLRASRPAERLLLDALAESLPIYSPHTALDAAPNGLNDWLARGVGPGTASPLAPTASSVGEQLKLVVFVPRTHLATLRSALSSEANAGVIGNYRECSFSADGQGSFFGNAEAAPVVGERGRLEFVDEVRLEMLCDKRALPAVAAAIAAHHPYEEPAWDAYPLVSKPKPNAGAGRLLTLSEPTSLETIIDRLKRQLNVSWLRVARSPDAKPIARVALCAGSGGSLFENVSDVDLFVTGEMSHHDVLAKVRQGASVILSEHTHTERGFLPELARRIVELSDGKLEALVAEADVDPLVTC
jgi:dinuclear metal center YbgI/SA1388 family protein